MSATLSTIILLLAQAETAGAHPWYNYPGFEAWKFINLFLFVGVLIFLLRRPVGQSMRARRESIRKELMRAQEERNAALAKLEEVNARLVRLKDEVAAVRARAEQEAAQLRAEAVRTGVVNQVVASSDALRLAADQVATSDALLASADA